MKRHVARVVRPEGRFGRAKSPDSAGRFEPFSSIRTLLYKGQKWDRFSVLLLQAGFGVDSAKSPLRSWCSPWSLARSHPALECSLLPSQSAGQADLALIGLQRSAHGLHLYDLQNARPSCIKMMEYFGIAITWVVWGSRQSAGAPNGTDMHCILGSNPPVQVSPSSMRYVIRGPRPFRD